MDVNETKSKSGMTLLELLIVVSIVLILSALILPTVSKLQARAGNAKCVANLRNIGVGMNAYIQDHGVYPYVIDGSTRWFDGTADPKSFFAGPYLESPYRSQRSSSEPTPSAKGGVFDCPVIKAADKVGLGPESWTTDFFDYAQNFTLCGRRNSEIAHPSKTVVVAEGGHYARVKAASRVGRTYTPAGSLNPGGTAWNYGPRSPLLFVHQGKGNFLFADGHVAAHEESELEEDWFSGK